MESRQVKLQSSNVYNVPDNDVIQSVGATYGPNIRRWMDTKRKADLGQCFIAVDPECFAPGFQIRMSDLMSYLRHMEPVGYSIANCLIAVVSFEIFSGGSQ